MGLRHGSCVSLVCALVFSTSAVAQNAQNYIMATSAPGTKSHIVGVALQSLVNIKLLPKAQIGLNTVNGLDDIESLLAVREGRGQFGIADSVVTDAAAQGTGPFAATGPDGDLMGVAVLWKEIDHFLIASDLALSGTFADLVALPAGRIATGSANRGAARALLTDFGMQASDSQTLPVVDGPGQLDALSQGVVGAMAISGPLPSIDMAQIIDALGSRVQLLEITGRQMARLGQGWHRHLIPGGTYASVDYDIDTVARSVMLLADASVDDDAVYQITQMMFENLPFLQAIDETAALISLNNALDGMNVAIHPGAARYFQEVGLLPTGSNNPADAGSLLTSAPSPPVAAALVAPARSENDGSTSVAALAAPSPTQPSQGSLATEDLPSLALDDAMLNRSRAEMHDGAEVLKIDRPDDLDRPGVEIVRIYFDLGATQPNNDSVAEAEAIGEHILQLYQSSKSIPEIYVEGHADRTGDWKINFEIAFRRAQATKEIMVAAGVPDDWIHISDHSEQKLAVPTEDGVGHWRNRRAEVTVIPTDEGSKRHDAALQ